MTMFSLCLRVAQALRSQKTKMLEGLQRAIRLAIEAEADGKASAAPPPKKRAAAVKAQDEAHTGALHKQCRLAQQEPAGCDISAAGCWERGDERAEALEWQI